MRVIVTGGGTGGHIYPALAIARGLMQRDPRTEVLYVGTKRGLEKDIVTREGLAFRAVEVEGLQRKISLAALRTAWLAVSGVWAARRIVREFRPDIVVGTGGYVVAPVMFGAYTARVKTAIVEMDARAGLANRLAARVVDVVMLGMTDATGAFSRVRRVVTTGNPRATEVVHVTDARKKAAGSDLRLPSGGFVITVFGGSRGASPLNRAVLEWLRVEPRVRAHVVWITGQVHFEQVKEALGDASGVTLTPFYHDMPALLTRTTLLISRAGATTLAEITALGVPAILVPSPYVTHRHQDDNAAVLANAGAAVVLPEERLDGAALHREVKSLLGNLFRLEEMAAASRRLGHPDALSRILAEIDRTVNSSDV